MKNQIILTKAVLAMGFFTLAYVLIVTFWPFQPAEFKEVQVAKESYVRGEPLDLIVDICKKMDLSAEITYELRMENPQTYTTLATYTTKGPAGECRRFIDRSVVIPESVMPGEYVLEVIATYHVNHFREVQYFFRTKKFEIM